MPKKKKKTMAVHEMAELLGLKKTDSYWLIHKQKFQTITVNGKTRVVIESFEKWYANQVKYKKAGGPPPGEELRRNTYSPQEIAELLGIDDTTVYLLIQKDHIPTIKVDYWMRIPKSAFESWYASQSRYRTPEDRERDREVEEASMTMPEMAKELGIDSRVIPASSRRGVIFREISPCCSQYLSARITSFSVWLRMSAIPHIDTSPPSFNLRRR